MCMKSQLCQREVFKRSGFPYCGITPWGLQTLLKSLQLFNLKEKRIFIVRCSVALTRVAQTQREAIVLLSPKVKVHPQNGTALSLQREMTLQHPKADTKAGSLGHSGGSVCQGADLSVLFGHRLVPLIGIPGWSGQLHLPIYSGLRADDVTAQTIPGQSHSDAV